MTRRWTLVTLGLLLGLLAPAWADGTRVQAAMERKGVLVRRLVADGGGVAFGEKDQAPRDRRQLYLDAVAVYEPLSADPEKSCARGVRLSVIPAEQKRPSNTFQAYDPASTLDLDECASILKALRHVVAVVKQDPKEFPQFQLVTRSGIVISTVDVVMSGSRYQKISLSIPAPAQGYYANLDPAQLEQFTDLLEKSAEAAEGLKLPK